MRGKPKFRISKPEYEIVIFGASHKGMSDYRSLRLKYKIKAFCDNDSKKWGNKLYGLDIWDIV